MTRTRQKPDPASVAAMVPDQARIDRVRKAAAGVDHDELIQQALAVQRLTSIDDVMATLKAAREAAGISLRELETRLKIPRGNLSRLESGRANPTVATLKRYAAAIGKTLKISVE